jgi:hypothetical protein
VQRNYEAASSFDANAFTDGMSSIVNVLERGEEDMAKRKAKKRGRPENLQKFRGYAGRSSGLKAGEFWQKLFKENSKAKLTDAKLAEAMSREFPDARRAFDEKQVRAHRSIWNNGRFPEQNETAPKRPLMPYDAKGEELPLRYRGEGAPPKKRTVKKRGRKAKAAPRKKARKVKGRKVVKRKTA